MREVLKGQLLHNDDTSHIKASPVGNGDDLTHLKGSFHGPPGTPYEGGNYIIDVKIPVGTIAWQRFRTHNSLLNLPAYMTGVSPFDQCRSRGRQVLV